MGQRIFSEIDAPYLADAIGARGYAWTLIDDGRDAAIGEAAALVAQWGPGFSLRDRHIPHILVANCATGLAAALDAGAADAVMHPIDPVEFAARIDARVRSHSPGTISIGDLVIDPLHRRVVRAGRTISLVRREFDLLVHLAEHHGTYVSRDTLLRQVWKLPFDPGTNLVAVQVSNLRAKIDRGFAAPLIHSARGLGYRLDPG